MDEEAAALKIEAGFRGHQGREKYKQMRKEEEAAIKIEARFRGHEDRMRVAKMREDRAHDAEEAAALKIEAGFRGHHDRERVKQMRKERDAATRIEAQFRGHEDRLRVAKMREERSAGRRQATSRPVVNRPPPKVHPDDMLFVDPGQIGSRKFLRQLHLGHRNVPAPIIYVIGTYDDMSPDMAERVRYLFSHGVSVAAAVSAAVIVDSGLQNQISSAETTPPIRAQSAVLGISRCEGMFGADPDLGTFHHQHIVVRCSPSEIWQHRLKVIDSISLRSSRSVIVIVAGSEDGCEELLRVAADRSWGIIVLEGSGGHAGELLAARAGTARSTHPDIEYAVANGNVSVFPYDCGPSELRCLCRANLMIGGLSKLWSRD